MLLWLLFILVFIGPIAEVEKDEEHGGLNLKGEFFHKFSLSQIFFQTKKLAPSLDPVADISAKMFSKKLSSRTQYPL